MIATANHEQQAAITCPAEFGSHVSALTKTIRIARPSPSAVANAENAANGDSPSSGISLFPLSHPETKTEPSKPLPTRTVADASAVQNPGPATKQGRHKKDPRVVSPLEASAQQQKRKGSDSDAHEAKGKKNKAEPRKRAGKGQENGTKLVFYLASHLYWTSLSYLTHVQTVAPSSATTNSPIPIPSQSPAPVSQPTSTQQLSAAPNFFGMNHSPFAQPQMLAMMAAVQAWASASHSPMFPPAVGAPTAPPPPYMPPLVTPAPPMPPVGYPPVGYFGLPFGNTPFPFPPSVPAYAPAPSLAAPPAAQQRQPPNGDDGNV